MHDSIKYREVLDAMISYCDYRDRCSSEVEQKLRGFDIDENLREDIYQDLKDRSIFDDQRFAEAYIGGKFRLKKWGKIKIRAELRMKRISDDLIVSSFQKIIDPDDYILQLNKLFIRKWELLKSKKDYSTQNKLYRYLYGKGYESELINELIKKYLKS